jgi:hypothetical protein
MRWVIARSSSAVRAIERSISRARGAEDDVARLDVEVDDSLLLEIVERRGELQAERQQLFRLECSLLPDHAGEARPLEVLEDEMRSGAVEHRIEPTHDHRMA